MLCSATSCINVVGALVMTLAIVISIFTISLMRSPTTAYISTDLNRSTAILVITMLRSRCILRGCTVIIPAHSRFEEIRRETTRGARSRMQMRDVVAHKGEIDISFSAGQDSEPEVVPAGSGTSAQRADNDLVSDDSRAFCVSPGERRRRAH